MDYSEIHLTTSHRNLAYLIYMDYYENVTVGLKKNDSSSKNYESVKVIITFTME